MYPQLTPAQEEIILGCVMGKRLLKLYKQKALPEYAYAAIVAKLKADGAPLCKDQ